MNRFAFRVSDEDRSHFTELALGGVHITVNIDPCLGGIFMLHEDATMNWTWLDEVDFSYGDVDESDLETATDAGEAIAAALLAARHRPSQTTETSPSVELAVPQQDLQRLHALRRAGYEIHLSLDPHTGGIDAVHSSGACLSWHFITDLQLEPAPDDDGTELRTDDLAAMMKAFQAAISS